VLTHARAAPPSQRRSPTHTPQLSMAAAMVMPQLAPRAPKPEPLTVAPLAPPPAPVSGGAGMGKPGFGAAQPATLPATQPFFQPVLPHLKASAKAPQVRAPSLRAPRVWCVGD